MALTLILVLALAGLVLGSKIADAWYQELEKGWDKDE